MHPKFMWNVFVSLSYTEPCTVYNHSNILCVMIEGVFTGSDDDVSSSAYVLPPDDYEIDKKFEMVSGCVRG